MPTLTPDLIDIARERLARKYLIETNSWCWIFTGTLNDKGYPQITIRGKNFGAHRLSYELHNGPIPEAMTVDHLCFNPPCVNPGHLRLLTNSDNAKNRYSNNRTHCDRGHEFSPENTHIAAAKSTGHPYRVCRACMRVYVLPGFVAGDGDPRHGTLNGYNRGKCRCDLCSDARREHSATHPSPPRQRDPAKRAEQSRRHYLEVTKPLREQRKLDKAIRPRGQA